MPGLNASTMTWENSDAGIFQDLYGLTETIEATCRRVGLGLRSKKPTKEKEWQGVTMNWKSISTCLDRVRSTLLNSGSGFPFHTEIQENKMTLLYKGDNRFRIDVERQNSEQISLGAFAPSGGAEPETSK